MDWFIALPVIFLISVLPLIFGWLIDPESNRRGFIRWYPDRQDLIEWWQRRPKWKDYAERPSD